MDLTAWILFCLILCPICVLEYIPLRGVHAFAYFYTV